MDDAQAHEIVIINRVAGGGQEGHNGGAGTSASFSRLCRSVSSRLITLCTWHSPMLRPNTVWP